ESLEQVLRLGARGVGHLTDLLLELGQTGLELMPGVLRVHAGEMELDLDLVAEGAELRDRLLEILPAVGLLQRTHDRSPSGAALSGGMVTLPLSACPSAASLARA